ncbi:autotransporter assembly complex protein TamA [Desulfobotulus sp. H1]|uniref:Autotransporter assembly complex protein TamA n=1 Tax=Desulfobotulus pelophilus TaxID=2823377 RepID=A0ABT3NBQ7_9BACT|nr:autotransporter assembly complex family protein [Desulfobotulus pelophilus]MCW7754893.1 autotransporter assembly complex protein TamA [Desulfobotulus pelophilus]
MNASVFSVRTIQVLILMVLLPFSAAANLLPFLYQDAYRVSIQGDVPPEIRNILEAVSDTFSMKDRPVPTTEMLRRRAANDIPDMTRALRSEGFYNSRITREVNLERSLPEVIFYVDTGPAYMINDIIITTEDTQIPLHALPVASDLRLTPGTRARAPEILQAKEHLKSFFRERGYPSPRSDLQRTLVNHAERTVNLHYTYAAEPQAFFGDTIIEGNERVHSLYVENRIPWRKGELFQASRLNRLRSQLMQDGLFAIVDIEHPAEPNEDLSLPVHVSLLERSPRTIRTGLFYETDTGAGTKLEWEHRNLRGMGERLSTGLTVAEKQQRISSEYRIPDFLDKRQSLTLTGWAGQEESEAYESEEGAVGAKLFRQLNHSWSGGIGVQYRVSSITQLQETQTYGLLSFPHELTWDKRNDVLNPTRGFRMQIKGEPFWDSLDTGLWFYKLYGSLSGHLPLIGEDRLVLSARGGVGSIIGESNLNIPADERFYGGGGGSIRGYAYQSIGPEEKGEVVGGRSMVETGLELRWRMKNNLGLVAFLDGGQVFTQSQLQLEDEFHWGAGLGLRYYTDFAPFRLDVAFPLNSRPNDDAFQLYISIGQAF